MLSPEKIQELKNRLVKEKKRVLETYASLGKDREDLVEREVEFEENAQKDGLLEPVSEVDDYEKDHLEAIDSALQKIELGEYGFCERCGRMIEEDRLEVLPSAALCSACRAEMEEASRSELFEEEEPTPELPPDLEGLSDDEILQYVLDELKENGRVDLDELTIACDHGIIHLDGFLPSEAQHQVLLEILLDGIGIGTLTDHVSIDPLLWETDGRAAGTRGPVDEGKSDDTALSDDDETSDAYASRTSGAPLKPPDELVPEDGKAKYKRRKT